MTARTDVHAPSRINPGDYEYVAMELIKIEGLGDALFLKAEREAIHAHMARTGGTYSHHEHGGNCMVCGSPNAIYTALFYHESTNSYVRMGTDCAEKVGVGDPGAFKRFRSLAEAAREAHAGKRKAEGLLIEHGLERAWALYETGFPECHHRDDVVCTACTGRGRYEERTIRDIVSKLVRFGSVSDKALDFVATLLGRIDTRGARMAARETERAAAAPCPTGRVRITGTVLSLKTVESDWSPNGALKMTVKADEGFVVFGTVPDSLLGGEPLRGARIAFSAAVEPSKDDPKFGFFRRPTKAERFAANVMPADVSAEEVA